MNGFIRPRYELRKLKFSRGVIFSDSVVKERISANSIAMLACTWSPRLTSRMLFFDRQTRNSRGTNREKAASALSSCPVFPATSAVSASRLTCDSSW